MIKFKQLLNEVMDAYKSDWINRYQAVVENGRLIAYHGTTPQNYISIQKNGFKPGAYFSLDSGYSKRITSIYHNIPQKNVILIRVKLPLDAVDFVAGDIVANRTINFNETL